MVEAEEARKRLAFDECLFMQLTLGLRRALTQCVSPSTCHNPLPSSRQPVSLPIIGTDFTHQLADLTHELTDIFHERADLYLELVDPCEGHADDISMKLSLDLICIALHESGLWQA